MGHKQCIRLVAKITTVIPPAYIGNLLKKRPDSEDLDGKQDILLVLFFLDDDF